MDHYRKLSDNELIILFREGNELAYIEIYNRYVVSLTDFAESKLYSFEDARDLIQDLFTSLWTERDTIQINEHLKAYLFAAVRYQVINKIRKNIVRRDYAEKLKSLSPAYCSLDEELNARELDTTIRKRLSQLPEKTKSIYQRSREQNKTIKEIAEEFKVSDQTVKNQISIALKHLRESLSMFLGLF
ncbi:RNA polymerase subunit sigma-70 [Pedobacter sp. HMWF019]|uniref:RNA polymerase sigma-70 factor n=1 Tax=Pedobacter sp. HMWF019 TaxID=2056856 RepID=UPI000D38235D|nr:RNA polymerase sigma-70 factor [Pedobacter sp. HMWF019]PTS97111.1 RNA polymerase subunit sigma-70 [Pedobacter sp. HMWF019]